MICIILPLKIYQMRKEKNEIPEKSFQAFYLIYIEAHRENCRKCDFCIIDAHRASVAKHSRSKKR